VAGWSDRRLRVRASCATPPASDRGSGSIPHGQVRGKLGAHAKKEGEIEMYFVERLV
jgi:hypothetical protein